MKAKKAGFKEVFYAKYAPVITGLAASIIIIGALFKLMHWPGANAALIIGMSTEAFVFAMFAFAPQHKDPDWTRVYPQLADDHVAKTKKPVATPQNTKSLDAMLAESQIDKGLIDRLGNSMRGLSDSVSKMSDITEVTVATKEYATNVRSASKSLTEMNQSYGQTVEALAGMSAAANDTKKYHEQVVNVTNNLQALNSVYEMELQDTNKHLEAMNGFYGNLSNAMATVGEASRDADQLKTEMNKLTTNLNSLNSVYGGMLSAMKV